MEDTQEAPAFRLGTSFPFKPFPPVPEHSITVDAGPIAFVIEARDQLDEKIPEGTVIPEELKALDAQLPDSSKTFGATLHVLETKFGTERLRFDCFEATPHYHYIGDSGQLIVRFDNIANEAIDWTMRAVADRLPEMLEFAEAPDAAESLRRGSAVSDDVLAKVRALLEDAHARASAHRHAGDTLAPTE